MRVNKFIEYFDLASEYRPGGSRSVSAAATVKVHTVYQYLALLAGIAVQPYFLRYMTTRQWDLSGFWGWLAASLIIALMAFPAVYKSSFDATKAIFPQLCVIFTAGTGWQTIVSSALRATGALGK